MNIFSNIKSFLYDENWFLSMFNNKIYIYNYLELKELTSTKVSLKMPEFNLIIEGANINIKKMAEKELIIEGTINTVKYK